MWPGDVLFLTRNIDAEWVEGSLYGTAGICPVAFVDVMVGVESASAALQAGPPALPPARPPPAKARTAPKPAGSASSDGAGGMAMVAAHAIATWDYAGDHRDELSFKVGQIIILIQKIDDEWLSGYLQEDTLRHKGIFPVAFVDVSDPQRCCVCKPYTCFLFLSFSCFGFGAGPPPNSARMYTDVLRVSHAKSILGPVYPSHGASRSNGHPLWRQTNHPGHRQQPANPPQPHQVGPSPPCHPRHPSLRCLQ